MLENTLIIEKVNNIKKKISVKMYLHIFFRIKKKEEMVLRKKREKLKKINKYEKINN